MPPTTGEKVIVLLTRKQKDFADEVIAQSERGEEPNPNKAGALAYPNANSVAVRGIVADNLRNPTVADYIVERISKGEILSQQEAFTYLQSESQELLADTKKRKDNRTRLGTLQFVARLYGLGAERVIVTEQTTSPKVAKIYDIVSEQ